MRDDRTEQAWEPANGQARCVARPAHRILIVDDDPCIRDLSSEILISSGYHVDAAEDGAVAWQALNTGNYDLVITDHSMPKVTGVELVKKMRAAHMAMPVILVSGAMPAEELDRHPWLRIEATLLKPFTIGTLLQTVQDVLRMDRSNATRLEAPLTMAYASPVLPPLVFQTTKTQGTFK